MVVHQNITNLAGYFHFLNVRKIPYVIGRVCAFCIEPQIEPRGICHKQQAAVLSHGSLYYLRMAERVGYDL
ncbi:MAG: hypothetical protein DESF_00809 [Desulfovibrio sp.]